MAAFVLTLILSLFVAAGIWFVVGSRFTFSHEDNQNDLLNFLAYYAGSIPVSFVIVFFGIG